MKKNDGKAKVSFSGWSQGRGDAFGLGAARGVVFCGDSDLAGGGCQISAGGDLSGDRLDSWIPDAVVFFSEWIFYGDDVEEARIGWFGEAKVVEDWVAAGGGSGGGISGDDCAGNLGRAGEGRARGSCSGWGEWII